VVNEAEKRFILELNEVPQVYDKEELRRKRWPEQLFLAFNRR